MNNTTILRWFALSRVALGLWLSVAPDKPGEIWFGSAKHPASTRMLLRSVGARDVGLGLGLAANPRPASLWLRAGILADIVDTTAAVLVRHEVPKRNFFTGFIGALAYAVIGLAIALRAVSTGDSDR
ncbi:hypothetical protein [uncultured Mycobacterium sp.]|uniref:hypothetical protein n=1 Tax=uncultured Mycobacterium sp. TaxID=171292 RepID=UPI0035CAE08F